MSRPCACRLIPCRPLQNDDMAAFVSMPSSAPARMPKRDTRIPPTEMRSEGGPGEDKFTIRSGKFTFGDVSKVLPRVASFHRSLPCTL